jgi:hypothetical protein
VRGRDLRRRAPRLPTTPRADSHHSGS